MNHPWSLDIQAEPGRAHNNPDRPPIGAVGDKWANGEYVLWASTEPQVALYLGSRPSIAVAPATGRPEVNLAVYRRRELGGGDLIVEGSLEFSIDLAPRLETETERRLIERMGLSTSSPIGQARSMRFQPLPVRNLVIHFGLDQPFQAPLSWVSHRMMHLRE